MHNLSAFELNKKFLNKELSAQEIVKSTLQRIETIDPKVESFLAVFQERAQEEAKRLDEKLAKAEPLGKLAGVPVALKDNIHVKNELSTCGSKFLSNFKAPFDATVSAKLKAEGAIFIGKTNCDEFAMGSSTEHSAFKKTKNPWDLTCVPGGSSGGSAAAVSARLVPVALGSDTGGSIRQPASFCGIVGFKPTYGVVSRYGLVAYGSSLDVIGPMTNNVLDAALVMDVIAGNDINDSTSLQEKNYPFLEEVQKPHKELTIGVPWSFLEQLSDEPRKLFEKSLKKINCKIVDVDLSILKYSLGVYYILATAEASTNLARFDGIRYGLRAKEAKTLEEVYEMSKDQGYGDEVKKRILLGTFVLSSGYKDAYYRKAQKVRTKIIQKFNEAFTKCDLIATPVTPFGAFPFGAKQDPVQMYLEDMYTIGINLAGLPAVSVPACFTKDNKPMGLQLIGAPKKDTLVLQAAYHFEQAAKQSHLTPDWVK